jgi:hypothetical protein
MQNGLHIFPFSPFPFPYLNQEINFAQVFILVHKPLMHNLENGLDLLG